MIALTVIVLIGGYVRLAGLGERSLWLDEFATWRVSRMELGPSLRWGPELTKPPLYQMTLRLLTDDPRPDEWVLRAPAAVCGLLLIVAGALLGYQAGGWPVGCALAGLIACQSLHIDLSQQARSYTLFALGCAASLYLWHRLVLLAGSSQPKTKPPTGEPGSANTTATAAADTSVNTDSGEDTDGIAGNNPHDPKSWARRSGMGIVFAAFVSVTVLTFHAHYLTVLVVVGQALWWAWVCMVDRERRRRWPPFAALSVTAILCAPMVVHYMRHQSSVFQGLDWIEPMTWRSSFDVLKRLGFGSVWFFALFLPAFALWMASALGVKFPVRRRAGGGIRDIICDGPVDWCGLLMITFVTTFGGLAVVAWLIHPAMVARYALPASIPLLLLPLIVAYRLDRRAPLFILVVFAVGNAPLMLTHRQSVTPGFRELSLFLKEHVDPAREAVVMAIDGTVDQEWADMERAAPAYYPVGDLPVHELPVVTEGDIVDPAVLRDPRGLYLIVFRADPTALLEAAGRRLKSIPLDGRWYDQLLFAPYRLLYAAPLSDS